MAREAARMVDGDGRRSGWNWPRIREWLITAAVILVLLRLFDLVEWWLTR